MQDFSGVCARCGRPILDGQETEAANLPAAEGDVLMAELEGRLVRPKLVHKVCHMTVSMAKPLDDA